MSGDFNNIITMDECKLLVEKKLGTKEFLLNKYFLKPISEAKCGFLGEHLSLNCEIVHNNQIKTVSFFIKKKLQNVKEYVVAEIAFNHDIFNNEKRILELITNKSVTPVTYIPKFYSYNEEKEYIVLENLQERGFTLSKKQLFDLKHCQVALDAVAKLHTFNFKYQHDKQKLAPNYSMFDEFHDCFDEVLFHENSDFAKKWMHSSRESLINFIDYLEPDQFKMSKQQLKELFKKKLNLLIEHSKSYKAQYNVITHGDLWGNNIMFRYSEDSVDEPCECCLVDFQVLRFLPPAQDVLFILYLSMCKEFRDKYLDELFNYYYKSLTQELNRVGLSSDLVYPMHEFKKHLKARRLHVLFINCIYKSFLLMGMERMRELMSATDTTYELQLGDRWKFIEETLRNDAVYRTNIMQEYQELIDEIVTNYNN